jgi:MoaA/NifB/PqqE/SkfB family radical SAM enzyme
MITETKERMKYQIKHLHIELSSHCNARCPLCPRNFQGYPANMGYTETHLDFDTIQKILSLDTLQPVEFILINGNFGDFVMNPQSIDILEYLKQSAPRAKIEIHTNGSARDRQFWKRLGELGVRIHFGVDGLSDTNHLYRQDTNFDVIMKNAQTFIDAGGHAIWGMTLFDHNRHQLPAVQELAAQMGFAEVRPRDTDRHTGPVYDRQGQKIHWFNDDWQWPDQVDEDFVEFAKTLPYDNPPPKIDRTVTCWAEKNQSVYIAADGHAYPCCWVGHNPHSYRSHTGISIWNDETIEYAHNNHAPTVGLHAAIEWFESLGKTWNTPDQPRICAYTCGK